MPRAYPAYVTGPGRLAAFVNTDRSIIASNLTRVSLYRYYFLLASVAWHGALCDESVDLPFEPMEKDR